MLPLQSKNTDALLHWSYNSGLGSSAPTSPRCSVFRHWIVQHQPTESQILSESNPLKSRNSEVSPGFTWFNMVSPHFPQEISEFSSPSPNRGAPCPPWAAWPPQPSALWLGGWQSAAVGPGLRWSSQGSPADVFSPGWMIIMMLIRTYIYTYTYMYYIYMYYIYMYIYI